MQQARSRSQLVETLFRPLEGKDIQENAVDKHLRQGIEQILPENTDWISHHIPEEVKPGDTLNSWGSSDCQAHQQHQNQ